MDYRDVQAYLRSRGSAGAPLPAASVSTGGTLLSDLPSFTTKLQGKTPVQVIEGIIRDIVPMARDFQEAGGWLVSEIRSRTLAGIDMYGQAFAPYSPRYATRKGSHTVSLYSSNKAVNPRQMVLFEHGLGHMLDALQVRVSGNVLEVGIFDSPTLAYRGRLMQKGWQPSSAARWTASTVAAWKWKGKGLRKYLMGKYKRKVEIVPPREWLGATSENKTEMRKILVEAVTERIVRWQSKY